MASEHAGGIITVSAPENVAIGAERSTQMERAAKTFFSCFGVLLALSGRARRGGGGGRYTIQAYRLRFDQVPQNR